MLTLGITFAVYSLLIVAIGLVASRRSSAGTEEYFLGGRKLGPWLAALSSGASGSSAWVTMGLVGLAFQSGLRAYWLIPGVLIGIAFNWLVLARPMRERSAQLGAVTVPDLLSMHFAERTPVVRLMSVGVILVAMFMYVAAQMAAAGQTFNLTFGLPYQAGVGIGVTIVLAYTVVGGFRAACWTDLVQSSVMLLALVAMPVVILSSGVIEGSPIGVLASSDSALVMPFPAGTTSTLALLGFVTGSGALGVNLGYPGQPHVLVRQMALREVRAIPIGAGIQIGWTVLIYAGAITTGVLVRAAAASGADWASAIDPAGQRELSLLIAAEALLPGVLAAVALSAVVSAMASTADSQLIVAASAVSADGYERLFARGRSGHSSLINRVTVLALGIGAGVLVLSEEVTVYEYVLTYGWAILGACFGPQIALAMLWSGGTRAGCIAGMATGFIVAVGWKLMQDAGMVSGTFYNLTVAFTASAGINVVVSLLTGSEQSSKRATEAAS